MAWIVCFALLACAGTEMSGAVRKDTKWFSAFAEASAFFPANKQWSGFAFEGNCDPAVPRDCHSPVSVQCVADFVSVSGRGVLPRSWVRITDYGSKGGASAERSILGVPITEASDAEEVVYKLGDRLEVVFSTIVADRYVVRASREHWLKMALERAWRPQVDSSWWMELVDGDALECVVRDGARETIGLRGRFIATMRENPITIRVVGDISTEMDGLRTSVFGDWQRVHAQSSHSWMQEVWRLRVANDDDDVTGEAYSRAQVALRQILGLVYEL